MEHLKIVSKSKLELETLSKSVDAEEASVVKKAEERIENI
jgi:hypothetical protein